MNFDLKEIQQAAGPDSALIFAARISMDLLQHRAENPVRHLLPAGH
jgi:hypothetical protein